ncbi:Cullin-domain-containing protein [Exidia glandulosa HHB12029]|uniref:Cullin-domain-containing protein n=1 Tax=Exidia glandulosa HHB12029 TaxID=1314781 RepID=A0A165EKV7_EXIGL|nr:Cullin-domain-containing protein [Exidia glandulosa HHB12029]
MSVPAYRKGKTKIKPPRARPAEASSPDIWNLLSSAIREIHNHNASKLSFEEIYRYAYNLVIQKHGELLYNGVKGLVRDNLDRLAREKIVPLFPTSGASEPMQQSNEGERLLKSVKDVWEDHCSCSTKLKAVLTYMDRSYTESAGVLPTYDMSLRLFLERIVHSSQYPIQRHLVATLLNQIRIEREGYTINQSSVKGCILIFLTLNDESQKQVYKTDFEPLFLDESAQFYKAEGNSLTGILSVPEYLQRVETRLTSEENRTNFMICAASWDRLRAIIEEHLITNHVQTVLGGLEAMVEHDNINDLSRLYRVLSMVPTGIPSLRRALKDSIAQRGKEINDASLRIGQPDGDADEPTDPKGKGKAKEKIGAAGYAQNVAHKWVEDVLALKDKFDLMLKLGLNADVGIQASIFEAFESFINLNPKAPEYISLFIDENLKKGLKGKTDDEVDAVLDKTITIFRFVTEKDVFERYYKTHLAKRLLHGRSVSDDAERGMLAKLKIECGFQFTQKLEGMFNDMKTSADAAQAYKEYLSTTDGPEVELDVTVMTSTFWPVMHTESACLLPTIMTRACKSYEAFYLARHSGRRLTWQPSLGNADVRVQFKARSHDLNVSTLALVILLLFEDVPDGGRLSYQQIKEATSIADVELSRNLQSLACAKFKVLRKHPAGRDVSQDDEFSFNDGFTAPLQRIKIAMIAARVEGKDETRETRAHIEEERKHQTEACIVRIMKDRKTMGHNDLINEVTRQLAPRFQPNPVNIKKRIEALIEREYLARGDDRKSYNYLA